MNWQAKHLTTVDKERIWKEYVSKETEHRGVYDEYRQRLSEKTRDPDIKISPRGKRFMNKEPFGIKMELNPETGRMTPMLTDSVLKSTNSPTRLRQEKEREERRRKQGGVSSEESEGGSGVNSYNSTGNFASSSGGGGGGVKLPALTLSSSALQQQQHPTVVSPTNALPPSPAAAANSPGHQKQNGGAGGHFIYARGSPRKGPNSSTQSALQQQFLLNNFSSSGSPHHGGGHAPEAALDKSLKNLQFMATSNSAIGRGTVEMLQGLPVGGLRSSPYASGATSPTAGNGQQNQNQNNYITSNTNMVTVMSSPNGGGGGADSEFGATLSGSLRTTYHSTTSPTLTKRNDYVPGSPRSYVVTDKAGAPVLFDYGKKQCEITRVRQELALRK